MKISSNACLSWLRSLKIRSLRKTRGGSEFISKNRRINKIAVSFELSGNQFFGFVPSAEFIRPLIGMAVNTTAMTRLNLTDNYQFLEMGALGIEIRGDYNSKSGVFYSVVV